jgi:hypothetical protein
MNHFGFQIAEDCLCEICSRQAVDIHHIEARGMGGDPKGKKDVIENLMAVCRLCHEDYGDVPELKGKLKHIHLKFMQSHAMRKPENQNVGTPIDINRV